MKCPNCGAENSERTVYCGGCATQLRENEPAERDRQILPDQPDLPPRVAKILDGSLLKRVIILIAILEFVNIVEVLKGDSDLTDVFIVVSATIALICILLVFISLKRRSGSTNGMKRYISYAPRSGPVGVGASATSISVASIAMTAGLTCVGGTFIALGLHLAATATNEAWLIAITMGVVFLVLVGTVATKVKTQVVLTKDGIRFHNAHVGVAVGYSRSDLSVVEIKGRILRLTLKDAPVGMFRQSKHLVLGTRSQLDEFTQAVQSFGLYGTGL